MCFSSQRIEERTMGAIDAFAEHGLVPSIRADSRNRCSAKFGLLRREPGWQATLVRGIIRRRGRSCPSAESVRPEIISGERS
jgi:hypothetical protein